MSRYQLYGTGRVPSDPPGRWWLHDRLDTLYTVVTRLTDPRVITAV